MTLVTLISSVQLNWSRWLTEAKYMLSVNAGEDGKLNTSLVRKCKTQLTRSTLPSQELNDTLKQRNHSSTRRSPTTATQIPGPPCVPCLTNHGPSFSQTNKSKWLEPWSQHLRKGNNSIGKERGREQQAFSLRHNNGLCKHLLHQYLARRHSPSPQSSLFTF